MLVWTIVAVAAADRDAILDGLAAATKRDVSLARCLTRCLSQELLCRRPVAADVTRLAWRAGSKAHPPIILHPHFTHAILTETLTGASNLVHPGARWADELPVHLCLAADMMLRLPCPPEQLQQLIDRFDRQLAPQPGAA